MSVVTRFPPSPTGFMHIGNARTAIYNWLLAKNQGGKFLFRIEDTDRARHSEEAVTAIINALEWLEMEWDGDIVSQFARREDHIKIAYQLLQDGKAYKCYATAEELEDMREEAKKTGRPVAYDRRWRDCAPGDEPQEAPFVIRIKAPLEGETIVHDLVQGTVTVQNKQIDDFILLRSDGTPTYMLSVVCDDHDMGVTHVVRGDDHLNNTFRQNVIYDAMGWDIPQYAHLPMILGDDGSKLSKRHGAVSIEDFRQRGYLPEAVFNYLLRLGWSHGDDEIISRTQAIEWFTLDNITKSAAKFDYDKLENLNAHYIRESDNERLLDLVIARLKEHFDITLTPNDKSAQNILAAMDELKSRAKSINQIADESVFFAKTIPYDFDEKATQILNDCEADIILALQNRLKDLDDFSGENVQGVCKEIAADIAEGKMGKIGMPLRAALTGTSVSPSIFHAAAIMGKDETLARLSYVLERFYKNSDALQANAH